MFTFTSAVLGLLLPGSLASCGEQGLLSSLACGLLIVVASPVSELGLQGTLASVVVACRFSGCAPKL